MQYILSEQEMNQGCELIEAWVTDEMKLDSIYIAQKNLNEQGFYTLIHCTDTKKDLYRMSVFERNK